MVFKPHKGAKGRSASEPMPTAATFKAPSWWKPGNWSKVTQGFNPKQPNPKGPIFTGPAPVEHGPIPETGFQQNVGMGASPGEQQGHNLGGPAPTSQARNFGA